MPLGRSAASGASIEVIRDLAGTAAELELGGIVSLLDIVNLYASMDYRMPSAWPPKARR